MLAASGTRVVCGCLAWQQEGLGTPPDVTQAIQAYQAEMDVLRQFFDDYCVVSAGVQVPTGALYQAYTRWCDRQGESALTPQGLGRQLTARGFAQHKGTGGLRYWLGLGLQAGPGRPQAAKSGEVAVSGTVPRRWLRVRAHIIRCGQILAGSGVWIQAPFLVDTGADRTVFSTPVLAALALQPASATERLGGVGGVVTSVVVATHVRFRQEGDGGSMVFRGHYAAVTVLEALDMSVLGRDITGLFALIVDRPGYVVCLLGQRLVALLTALQRRSEHVGKALGLLGGERALCHTSGTICCIVSIVVAWEGRPAMSAEAWCALAWRLPVEVSASRDRATRPHSGMW